MVNDYHAFLLMQIQAQLNFSLDIGCGTGEVSRLLARRCLHMLGLDFSPVMIQVDRSRMAGFPGLEYQAADVTSYDLAPESYL